VILHLKKIDDFASQIEVLAFEATHFTVVKKSLFAFLFKLMDTWRVILLVLTLLINGLMIGYFVQDDNGNIVITDNDTIKALRILAIMHAVVSAVWVGTYTWLWAPIIVFKEKKERRESRRRENALLKKLGKKPLPEPKENIFNSTLYLLGDNNWIYGVIFLVMSLIGLGYVPCYSFHMLDISFRSAQVRNVLKSVTINGKALLLTALLCAILIYLFSMLAFFFFNTYFTSINGSNGSFCNTQFQCLLTALVYGLRAGGGLGDIMSTTNFYTNTTSTSIYAGAFFIHLSFFIFIIVIVSKVVFGIILDSFGELRDDRQAIEEDIKSFCFICSIDNDEFQRKAYGFKHHSKFDHNVWHYFYFLVYLQLKDKDEYTSAEEYVAEKHKQEDISYFPIGKALVLEHSVHEE